MHYITHALIFFAVIALDIIWLVTTGRFETTYGDKDNIMFVMLSRFIVYSWIAFTVLPSIKCSGDTTATAVIIQGAFQGLAAFGFWNFANVSSMANAKMPFIDTLWGMIVTVIIALFSLDVDQLMGVMA